MKYALAHHHLIAQDAELLIIYSDHNVEILAQFKVILRMIESVMHALLNVRHAWGQAKIIV